MNRRDLLKTSAIAGGAVALGASRLDATETRWEKSYAGVANRPMLEPGLPNKDYSPVITPSGTSLAWKISDQVKVYHLIAEEVSNEFAPGLKAKCWGYNGQVHGPTIEAVEGDRIRVYVTNRLQAPTTVHWHGVFLPNGRMVLGD